MVGGGSRGNGSGPPGRSRRLTGGGTLVMGGVLFVHRGIMFVRGGTFVHGGMFDRGGVFVHDGRDGVGRTVGKGANAPPRFVVIEVCACACVASRPAAIATATKVVQIIFIMSFVFEVVGFSSTGKTRYVSGQLFAIGFIPTLRSGRGRPGYL